MARAIDIVEGLKILAKYAPKGLEEHIGGANHDIIFGLDIDQATIPDEDIILLDRHGWFYRADEGWVHFC
jgi:hypothetical protein